MDIKNRKLILHFDQHNTIQIACKCPSRTIKQGLNNFLTSVTWGEEINDEWVWRCSEPILDKPIEYPNSITYFKYLEKKLVLNLNDRGYLYEKTNKFTDTDGVCFKEFYKKCLNRLKLLQNEDINSPNTIIEDNEYYHYILPSFFYLIKNLKENNYKFSIILRSYGRDSDSFLKILNEVLNGNNDTFKEYKNFDINVNLNIGEIIRDPNNSDIISLKFDNEEYFGEKNVYDKINSIDGICAIRDHFESWQKKSYSCYYAKPVWLKYNDNNYQHILFDDNIRFDSSNNCIANLRIAKNDNFENVDFNDYCIYKDIMLIQPDILEYFKYYEENNVLENFYYNKIVNAYNAFDKFFSK